MTQNSTPSSIHKRNKAHVHAEPCEPMFLAAVQLAWATLNSKIRLPFLCRIKGLRLSPCAHTECSLLQRKSIKSATKSNQFLNSPLFLCHVLSSCLSPPILVWLNFTTASHRQPSRCQRIWGDTDHQGKNRAVPPAAQVASFKYNVEGARELNSKAVIHARTSVHTLTDVYLFHLQLNTTQLSA